jgi:hypothetical protein
MSFNVPNTHDLFPRFAYMIQFFYIASVSSVKISVLLFYKRTFHSLSYHFVHCVYVTLTIIVLWTITVQWTITFSIVTLLQEWPIAAFWDNSIPNRWKIGSLLPTYCGMSSLLDFLHG